MTESQSGLKPAEGTEMQARLARLTWASKYAQCKSLAQIGRWIGYGRLTLPDALAYLAGLPAAQPTTNTKASPQMKTKIIEIRDEGTFIAALCVDMNPQNDTQRYYLRRYGYRCDGRPNILITHAAGDGFPATNDPYAQKGRTWPIAHNYIVEHWDDLNDGDVVDVSFIKGETSAPKLSERVLAQAKVDAEKEPRT